VPATTPTPQFSGVPAASLTVDKGVVSGGGKTVLIENIIAADMRDGFGVCVLDPHGDLTRQVIARLPDGHADRVQLFDLHDPQRLPTINPLWVPSEPSEGVEVARAVRSAITRYISAGRVNGSN